ncbi:MAG: hypothetical protein GYB65_03195 [Chloroflexi bacterium]|nr:hypothetical protein [Chloroflexota bacterium]
MNQQRTEKVAALLHQAGAAHHAYEQDELKGVHDEDWANWYAAWALENGLNELLDLNASVLASLLVKINATYQQSDSGDNWAQFTAARLVEKHQR